MFICFGAHMATCSAHAMCVLRYNSSCFILAVSHEKSFGSLLQVLPSNLWEKHVSVCKAWILILNQACQTAHFGQFYAHIITRTELWRSTLDLVCSDLFQSPIDLPFLNGQSTKKGQTMQIISKEVNCIILKTNFFIAKFNFAICESETCRTFFNQDNF